MASREDELIAVEDVELTAFGKEVSPWTAYKLIRDGHLGCVQVGRRKYLTNRIVSDFISSGGVK